MELPIEIKDIADYFCVSESSIYSSIKSTLFSLTSSSVLPCVAMSNMGQDATSHFPSLHEHGGGYYIHVYTFIAVYV